MLMWIVVVVLLVWYVKTAGRARREVLFSLQLLLLLWCYDNIDDIDDDDCKVVLLRAAKPS